MGAFLAELASFGIGTATQLIPFQGNLSTAVQHWSNARWPNSFMDIDTLWEAQLRGILGYKEFLDLAGQLGFDANQIEYYKVARETVEDLSSGVTLDLEKRLSPELKEKILKQNDIKDDVYQTYLKAHQWWPSVADMMRFNNQDIFSDKTAERYSLDSYFDDKIKESFAKTGVPEEWIKYVWRSSWRYPSYYEGKYMYDWSRAHPNQDAETNPDGLTFNINDFKYLMRVSNYPEYFQKLYSKILSTPLSYRQIAELYQHEIISAEEMPKWLKWAGYNDEQIGVLVKLFEVMYAPEGKRTAKTYTLSVIEALYEHGKLSKDEFEAHLQDLGYTKAAVEIYTDYIDLKQDLEAEKELISETKSEYKSNMINDTTASQRLINGGVDLGYANALITQWKAIYKRKPKAIPLGDLKKMVQGKIINMSDFGEQMELNGYNSQQIGWYKKLFGF